MKINKVIFCLLLVFILIAVPLCFYLKSNSFFPSTKVKRVLIYPQDLTFKNNKDKVDLVFFFHGAGCDETFVFSPFSLGGLDLKNTISLLRDDLVFVSFGYDSPFHWASPDVVKATIKKIKEISKGYKVGKIVLIGVSMGGTLALNVLSIADKDLQNKISDVFAVFPIVDYQYTILNTKRENILSSLKKHFYGFSDPIKLMKLSSPINYVSSIPQNTRIVLVEGLRDTHVGSKIIEDYYNELIKTNTNSILVKWDTDHLVVNFQEDFKKWFFSLVG